MAKRPLSMKFMARYQRSRRRKHRKAGKCSECGRTPEPGKAKCADCRKYQRQWYHDNEQRDRQPRTKAS